MPGGGGDLSANQVPKNTIIKMLSNIVHSLNSILGPQIRFGRPEALLLLVAIPLAWVLFRLARRKRQRETESFVQNDLALKVAYNHSARRIRLRETLWIIGAALLILAFANPRVGTRLVEVKREGVDIIVALDVSQSMRAEDIAPSRLEKAKHEVSGFIQRLKGDRIGLVAFSGAAFLQCPLTTDYSAARIFLDVLDTDLIPVPGTAIADAIKTCTNAFLQGQSTQKVIVLITDGEDHQKKVEEAAREASDQKIVIYTVGMGSPEGEPIPLVNEQGQNIGYKKDENGQVVVSRLNEDLLTEISDITGGDYYRGSPGESELDKIYNKIFGMQKGEIEAREFTDFEDRFQWFLLPGLLCFLVEAVVGETRSSRKTKQVLAQ
jgi:Ca-activated chloride channel family protein